MFSVKVLANAAVDINDMASCMIHSARRDAQRLAALDEEVLPLFSDFFVRCRFNQVYVGLVDHFHYHARKSPPKVSTRRWFVRQREVSCALGVESEDARITAMDLIPELPNLKARFKLRRRRDVLI